MSDDYPAGRLAELLAAVDDAPRLARDADDAKPEVIEAVRSSAAEWFLEWPEAKQINFLETVTEREQDDLLSELPAEAKRRLASRRVPEAGTLH